VREVAVTTHLNDKVRIANNRTHDFFHFVLVLRG